MNKAPTPPEAREPRAHGGGRELGPVVGPDVLWGAPRHEQPGQDLEHLARAEAPPDPDRQALPAELVHDHEHPEHLAVTRAVLDEVVRPDVVRALGPETHAGAVVQPQPAPLRLLAWHLEPLAAPDPLDPLRVHPPAGGPQQGGDPPVAVAAVRARERDDVGRQQLLVRPGLGGVALHGAVLPQGPAGPPL
jgi:hypothetical protein